MNQNYLIDEVMDIPTDVELTVGLLAKSARLSEVGAAKSITVRMPLVVFSTVKAMSEYSGQSLNRIIVQLIRSGIHVVGESIPDEDGQAIAEIRAKSLAQLLAEFDGEQMEDK